MALMFASPDYPTEAVRGQTSGTYRIEIDCVQTSSFTYKVNATKPLDSTQYVIMVPHTVNEDEIRIVRSMIEKIAG